MSESFDRAAGQTIKQQERADFDLGLQIFDRLRYRGTDAAFDAMRELVVPHMKALGVDVRIAGILKALDPATDNINTQDTVADLWSELPAPVQGLRDLVYPKPEILPETGSASNRDLARILNTLSQATNDLRGDPVDALKRPATGDKVLYLPEDPDKAVDKEMLKHRLEQGALFKEQIMPIVKRDLAGFLFDKDRSMSDELKFALYRMPEILEDGGNTARDISRLATHLSEVGYQVRETGRSVSDASALVAQPAVQPYAELPIPPKL